MPLLGLEHAILPPSTQTATQLTKMVTGNASSFHNLKTRNLWNTWAPATF